MAVLSIISAFTSSGSSTTGTTAPPATLGSTVGSAPAAVASASATPRRHSTAPVRADGSALSLITEPNDGVTPILDQIKAAKRSVDLVIYELSDPAFEAALVADVHHGVKVRVMLNGGYYAAGGFSQNDAAFAYLKHHGVAVRSAPAYFALTHQKTIVIDDKVADIMTLNLTSEYYSSSRDFAVIDRQPGDVAGIEATFNADWTANRITAPTGSGDLIWSPGALDSQLDLINEAHSSIDIYNEEMADSQITGALASAARRGVDVKVVMTADSAWDSAFAELAAAGVHVRTYSEDASLYIHAKMILVDGTKAFLGSQNFSAGSLDRNRELGITLSDRSILTSLGRTFASDYAGAESSSPPAAAQPTPVVGTPSPTSAGCSVHASYSARYGDWDVDVTGAPPDTEVTATADGYTHSYRSDSVGYVDVYVDAPESAAGDPVSISAGSASCTGTL